MIQGTEKGGAIECKTCDEGSIANSKLYMCTKCEMGFQPNSEQSECEPCQDGTYNPFKGGVCQRCPDYTYSSEDRTYCKLHDELVVNKTFKYHTHLLQPFELCAMSQNYDYCTDNDVMGPIFASPATAHAHQGNVFFIASHDRFDGESGESLYEYHEIKGGIDYGYMFGLFSMRNASWTDIKNTLMQTEENIGAKVDGDC